MRRIATVICALVCCIIPTSVLAQSCKADILREDRITKEQVEVWTQELSATSFAASFMSTSELSITATVGRYGNLNAVNLQIQKKEESATNAAFESALRGAKGNPFYFGFKGGAPVAFVVTEVGNSSKVQQGLFAAKGVTTVVLSAVISDSEMATLRDELTTRQVDGVRIVLAGEEGIEKPVNDNNGRKLKEKFSCFYQSMDSKGIALSATAKGNSQPEPLVVVSENGPPQPVPGQYATPGGSRLLLRPDGSLIKFVGSGQSHGRYAVDEENLTLTYPSTGFSQHFKIHSGKLLDVNTHQAWTRMGEGSEGIQTPLPDVAPPTAKLAEGEPTLGATLEFIQEKLSEQGQIGWAQTLSTQPGLTIREFVIVSDIMAEPASCTIYATLTADMNIDIPKGRNLKPGVTADDLQTHAVLTDTILLKHVEKITVETRQDLEYQGLVDASHPEISITVTPPSFGLKLWASSAVFSSHTSTVKGKAAPVEKDETQKTLDIPIRDENTANRVAKAMSHAMELCGGGVTKKEIF